MSLKIWVVKPDSLELINWFFFSGRKFTKPPFQTNVSRRIRSAKGDCGAAISCDSFIIYHFQMVVTSLHAMIPHDDTTLIILPGRGHDEGERGIVRLLNSIPLPSLQSLLVSFTRKMWDNVIEDELVLKLNMNEEKISLKGGTAPFTLITSHILSF